MIGNNSVKMLPLLAGPAVFIITLLFFHPENLSAQANAVLATTLWVAIWWIFEVVDISVTALLPIVLFPLTGALGIAETTASYGHKYVFLYMGGFIIAIAIEKWNLHRRIALTIISWIGAGISKIILGFMVATAFLSMWISNTATSVMMLPIGLAIVAQLKDHPATVQNEHLQFGKALMLAIAYSASLGGMATLIGTPPNLVFAGVVQELYGVEITFSRWIVVGMPISLVLLTVCWFYLTRYAFKFPIDEFPGGKTEIKRLLRELGPTTKQEKMVMWVFIITGLMWICRSLFLSKILPGIDDTIIAISAGIILFILPAGEGKGKILTWIEAVKMPWGIIILFGGGMALASGFQDSGLAAWIGNQLTLLQGVSLVLIMLIIIASVNFLTEITSNLATTAMLLPVLGPMALGLDIHPYMLLVGATTAATCAFMLPVATPPNAVVFGSRYLRIPDMVKTGIWMNLISIIFILVFLYFLLPILWGFDPGVFPDQFKK